MTTMTDYQAQGIDFLKQTGVKMTVTQVGYEPFPDDPNGEAHDTYRVTFSRQGKQFSVRFHQSLSKAGSEPTAYDVLSCLEKSDPGTFEDFCSEFGYDTDSRKAERVYKAVCRDWKKVSAFFTGDEIEALQEIQ